jgi:hypothetical protein
MKVDINGLLWVKSSEVNNLLLIKRKLTLAEVESDKKAKIHYLYEEKDDHIGIPRSFFSQEMINSCDATDYTSNGIEIDDINYINEVQSDEIKEGCLPDESFDQLLNQVKSRRDSVLVFNSESSAVINCLRMISLLKMKTLIICRDESRELWDKMINLFFESSSIDKHVSLFNLDMVSKLISDNFFDKAEFGLVVTHQIEKTNPILWSKAVPFFSCSKRIGTSISNKILIGKNSIYNFHLGSHVFSQREELPLTKIRRVWSNWKISDWANKINHQFISKDALLDKMCTSTIYNGHVMEQILLAMTSERKIVVVSDRVPHLKLLKSQIESKWSGKISTVDYILSGMLNDDIATASKADVILTTFLSLESFPEIPSIDTVFLATPTRDPSYAVKICSVNHASKKTPIVVDLRCDDIFICKEYGKSRDLKYKLLLKQEDAQDGDPANV